MIFKGNNFFKLLNNFFQLFIGYLIKLYLTQMYKYYPLWQISIESMHLYSDALSDDTR